MNKNQSKFNLTLNAAFVLVALVIIVDFILPGRIVNDEINNVEKERQQYYNAARNYHFSYKVITHEHEFYVTEDFAELVQDHKNIEYSVSRIFEEVNWYRLLSSENRGSYSLRIISGLVLPLLTIFSIAMAYRYKMNIDILVFVFQTILIADLIFLLV
jgi:hypothetical protein